MKNAERPPPTADRTTPDRLLTRVEVERRTRLSRSTIYRLMRIGQFPRPYRIGLRGVRWSEREIGEWLASRPRSYGPTAATPAADA